MSINIQFDEKVMRKTEEPRLSSPGHAPTPTGTPGHPGLHVERHYTKAGVDPFDAVEWTTRKPVIKEPDGSIVFQVDRCEVPKEWSQLATDIIVSKYFRKAGVPQA